MDVNPEILAAREKLKEKFAGSNQVGGKGTARRKGKKPPKSTIGDEKRVQMTLSRLGLMQLGMVEEVTMVMEDGSFMVFRNPKIKMNMVNNLYVVTGGYEVSSMLTPETQLLHMLSRCSTDDLQKLCTNIKQNAGTNQKIEDIVDETVNPISHDFEAVANE